MLGTGRAVEQQFSMRRYRVVAGVQQQSSDDIGYPAPSRFTGYGNLASQAPEVLLEAQQLSCFAAALDAFQSNKKWHKSVSWVV
jgi:organic hydroperoxide reductase OsmC/OhrA